MVGTRLSFVLLSALSAILINSNKVKMITSKLIYFMGDKSDEYLEEGVLRHTSLSWDALKRYRCPPDVNKLIRCQPPEN